MLALGTESFMSDAATNYSDQLISVWDIYIKFWTVFLTVNLAALGIVIEKVHDKRGGMLIATAFVAQTLIGCVTAVLMSSYSSGLGASLGPSTTSFLEPLRELGRWGGYGNAAGHIVLAAIWIVAAGLKTAQRRDGENKPA